MKTTNKYVARLRQPVSPDSKKTEEPEAITPDPYPRDIILMRIRQIFMSARNL